MCFVLYLATNGAIPAIDWNPQEPSVHTKGLDGNCTGVAAQFSMPNICYIGSDQGCGCGFRSAMLQDGGWPEADWRGEEWFEEQLNEGEEEKRGQQANHERLRTIVNLAAGANQMVELYGCWSGDEQKGCEQTINIRLPELVEPNFVFRERCKYRVTIP